MQADEAVTVMENTKQILNQFIWNSGIHSEPDLKHTWVRNSAYYTLLSFYAVALDCTFYYRPLETVNYEYHHVEP
jgi:hypothetical protein